MSLRALATVVVTTVMMLPHAWADTAWESYKSRFMMPDGRIIDTGNGNVSHTEGQGFAMLLAVGNNDRPAFDKLWQWTDKTLRNKENGLFYWRYNPAESNPVADKNNAADGDVLIALGSSGPHSNGYSLVRKIVEVSGCDPEITELEGKPLADHLLAPTRIYVKSILELIEKVDVHAIAHLTGGGFWENIPRVLPDNTQAVIDESSWQWPAVFNWLQTAGNVSQHEMYRTFNCGVGMVIALPAPEVDKALALLNEKGENAWKIGIIKASDSEQRVVIE